MSDADSRQPDGPSTSVNDTKRLSPGGHAGERDPDDGATKPLGANPVPGPRPSAPEGNRDWRGLGQPPDHAGVSGWGDGVSWGPGGTGASWGAAGSGGDSPGPASGAPGPASTAAPDAWPPAGAGAASASGPGAGRESLGQGSTWAVPTGAPPWGQDDTRPIAEPSGAGPGWGTSPPTAGGRPPGRWRTSRLVAGALAVVLLIGAGFGLGQLRDRGSSNAAATGGAGIPVTVAPSQIQAGTEPIAAVAKALLPSVVQIETGQGLGSGVIYDKNGYILTAAHVVEGAGDQVTVRLADGTKLTGRVVGTDAGTDIGVVKVDRNNLQPAALALKVQLQVGQTAVAIGSPFGLEGSVTSGVVSAVNRSLPAGRGGSGSVFEVIQTDAPINPGNSGGALADRQGRVIGINDSIQSESGGNEGVGFAVPIDIAAASATRIVQGKSTASGYLGVGGTDPTLGRAGALINEVVSGSPAEKAGLQVGDLVVAVNGKQVQSMDDLAAQVRLLGPGQRATLTVVRGGKEQTVTATLTNRPNE
jgi:putative serine protease PepD